MRCIGRHAFGQEEAILNGNLINRMLKKLVNEPQAGENNCRH
jgi:hypothetical protein